MKAKFAGEVIPEAAPHEGHEMPIGEAEAAVNQVHGMVRTLGEAVQLHIGAPIPGTHPAMVASSSTPSPSSACTLGKVTAWCLTFARRVGRGELRCQPLARVSSSSTGLATHFEATWRLGLSWGPREDRRRFGRYLRGAVLACAVSLRMHDGVRTYSFRSAVLRGNQTCTPAMMSLVTYRSQSGQSQTGPR